MTRLEIGEIIDIQKNSTAFTIKILVGINIINVHLWEPAAKTLHVGDQVTISSSAFNPIIQRVQQ